VKLGFSHAALMGAMLACAAGSPAPVPQPPPAPAPVASGSSIVIPPAGETAEPQAPAPTPIPSATGSNAQALPSSTASAAPDKPGEPGAPVEATDDTMSSFARKMYMARVSSFLQAGLTITGVGLSPEERARLRAEARCNFDAKLVVLECFTTRPSGNAAFDLALAKHLQSKKGLQAPPPPEDRPELTQKQLTFSVVCGRRCE
jgi:hypothetical protein